MRQALQAAANSRRAARLRAMLTRHGHAAATAVLPAPARPATPPPGARGPGLTAAGGDPGSWTAFGWYDRDGQRHWFPEPVIIPGHSLRTGTGPVTAARP